MKMNKLLTNDREGGAVRTAAATSDRRDFLKNAGMAAAGALSIGMASRANFAVTQSINQSSIMKTRKFGSLEVSELGFGNMGLSSGHYGPGVDKAQGIKVIRTAYERG